MKYMFTIITTGFLINVGAGCATGVEQVPFSTIREVDHFELRDYPQYLVAETEVDGTLEDAGSIAFQKLFGYISGKNTSREKIAMTSPVTQEPRSESIAMTAPVEQQRTEGGWMVSFTMPGTYTMDTLPVPEDPAVRLREVPARRLAVVRYSGTWSEKRYLSNLKALRAWIAKNGFTISGEPVWARYDPPFKPWFLRRNEILIPVTAQ